jgi:uncharacterized protein
MAVVPMFPLGTVLLPGGVLPLHVFEPRYRQMVSELLAGEEPEFGVSLIERGSEVGGGDLRTSVATIARIVQAAALPDGRYALVAVGTRRIVVRAWLPDDPYPVADVDEWPDTDPDAPVLDDLRRVNPRVRRALALAVELGDTTTDALQELSDDPLVASYHLAALAPIGSADRHRLLACAGPLERLALLDRLLDDVDAAQRFRLLGPDPGRVDDGSPWPGPGGAC